MFNVDVGGESSSDGNNRISLESEKSTMLWYAVPAY